MNKAFIIARKDIKEAFQSRTTYLYIVLLCFLSLPYFDGLRSIVNGMLKNGATPEELRTISQSFLSTAIYTLPLVLTMLICGVFSAYSVIMDKTRRTIESLLATPVSLRQVWFGKTLAVALPGIIISLIVSLLAVIAMNFIVIMPILGYFIVPAPISLVTGLVIIPVLVFFVVSLVIFLQLIITNPRLANFVFTGVFLGIYMSTVTRLTASWNFALIYLLITVVLAAVTFYVAQFLTKERVILSSKG